MNLFKNYQYNLFLNLFLVYTIWGSTYLGVKIGLQDLSPMLLTALRFTSGGCILFLFSLFKTGLPKKDEFSGSALIGVLLTGIGTSAVCFAILYIPSGLVALLVALLPVWVFILDYFFFSKTGPSPLSGFGMVLGIIGVIFIFNPFSISTDIGLSELFPICVVFAGSISWAYGSLISPKTSQIKGIQGTSVQMLSGGSVALILSLVLEDNQLYSLIGMSKQGILAMCYLVLIGSFIGYSAYVWLINNAPPILTSSYAFVNPVVAMILGYYLAEETLSQNSIMASVIILIGIIFMTLGRRRKGKF